MTTEANYVAGLALRCARQDQWEPRVNTAPKGGTTPIRETIREYLGGHDPFPDHTTVEVLCDDGSWEPATIIDRPGVDEWTVEYLDGEQACRDHQQLRPKP